MPATMDRIPSSPTRERRALAGIGSDFVPYTGAIKDVDLGSFDLTTTGDMAANALSLINDVSTITFGDAGLTDTLQMIGGGTLLNTFIFGNAGASNDLQLLLTGASSTWATAKDLLLTSSDGGLTFRALTVGKTISLNTPIVQVSTQLNVGGDITMQGHLLTLGDGTATDIVIQFSASAFDGTLTFDESDNEFDFGTSVIRTTGLIHGQAGYFTVPGDPQLVLKYDGTRGADFEINNGGILLITVLNTAGIDIRGNPLTATGGILIAADSIPITFGAGNDAAIDYVDGLGLRITDGTTGLITLIDDNLTTTGIGTFGEIIDSGLTINLGVYTDGSKQLTSTVPSSGILGYWTRAGTVLNTANAGDDITITGLMTIPTVNSTGDLYLNRDTLGDVILFSDGTVANNVDGKRLIIYRNATSESDRSLILWIDQFQRAIIKADGASQLHLEADTGGLYLNEESDSDIKCFDVSGNGETRFLSIRGYPSGESIATLKFQIIAGPKAQITCDSGEIDFDDENLATTGDFQAGKGSFGDSITAGTTTRALNLISTDAVMRIWRVHDTSDPAFELIAATVAAPTTILYMWDMFTKRTDGTFNFRDRSPGQGDVVRSTIETDGDFDFKANNLDTTGTIGINADSVAMEFGASQDAQIQYLDGVGLQITDTTTGLITFGDDTVASIGKLGVGVSSPTWTFELSDDGPIWASYSTIHDAFRAVVNGFPITAQFGMNEGGITEVVVGAVEVPNTSAAGNHSCGVAGYGRSASPNQGAVGIFGCGLANADGVSAWGANILVTNTPLPNPPTQTGHNTTVAYGIELNINIMKDSGGNAPGNATRGIYMIGASEVQPTGAFNAVDIDSPGLGETPILKWKTAYYVNDGVADTAIAIGTTGTGNGVGSQPIAFRSRDGGGNTHNSTFAVGTDENFILTPHGGETIGVGNIRTVSGNLGVGSTSPSARFHVVSDTQYDGFAINNSSYTVMTLSGFSGTNDAGGLILLAAGVNKIQLLASGDSLFRGGPVELGSATDYARFEADGTLLFTGAATVFKDINIGAGTLSGPPGKQPGIVNFVDEAGADTGIATFGLAVGEGLSGFFEIQHDYKEGSNITFHVHWQGIAVPAGGTDNVQFQLTYTVSKNNETLDAVTVITAETAINVRYDSKVTAFTIITGTNFNIEDQFIFTLERIAASADEYGGEALIQTVGIHYEVNTVGSRQILVK